jgi:hypothetical protein
LQILVTMTKEERIRNIQNSEESGEVKSITYKGLTENYRVKIIKLENLLYNPYNGRIRSSVLSYESRANKLLSPSDESDKLIIEQFLYDSAVHRNEKTIESLEEKGQQEIGIVTKDGIIIDGNRRALLLNIINKNNNKNIPFKAIVLPDELENNRREITLLETGYQMGVDSKVDYNPIEKYIRCQELRDIHGLKIDEISSIMAEENRRIQEWLDIFNLMIDYLDYLDTPKLFTRLEKREGHFVDLKNYVKSYHERKNNNVKWDYKEEDIKKMKECYFDYIRLGIPVQSARVIAKPTSSNSLFCHNDIWAEFIEEHKINKAKYTEESFISIKDKEDGNRSNEDIVRFLDEKWKNEVGNNLLSNLSYSESLLKDIFESHAPIKILRRVINNIGQIKIDSIIETDKEEALRLTETITAKLNQIKENLKSNL